MKIKINNTLDINNNPVKRYSAIIGNIQVNLQTDGVNQKHISKEEFKEIALKEYKKTVTI